MVGRSPRSNNRKLSPLSPSAPQLFAERREADRQQDQRRRIWAQALPAWGFDAAGTSCLLGEHENEMQMNARPKPAQSEFVADSWHVKPSVDPPAIRMADLENDLFRSGRSSLGNLDPLGSLGRLHPLA